MAQAGMFACITGSPFVFIDLFGVPAEHYCWIFGSNALGLIALSQINGRRLRFYNPTGNLRICVSATAFFSLLLIFAGVFNFGFWGVTILIFLFVASLGMIFPNATASALLGSLQYGLAACASSLVSYLNNSTALTMTAIIGACGIPAFLVLNLLLGTNDKKEFAISEEHVTFG